LLHGTTAEAARTTAVGTATFVLGCGSRDAHRSVAAVDALHCLESALLLGFFREADEAVAARHAGHGVRHYFGGFAGWELGLEEGVEDVFVYFRAEVADENGEFWSALFAAGCC